MTELQMLNAGNNDLQWFSNNYKKIKEDHADEFVAVRNSKIICSGKTLDDILTSLRKKGIDSNEVLIEFISKIPIIL